MQPITLATFVATMAFALNVSALTIANTTDKTSVGKATEVKTVRWTGAEDSDSRFDHVLSVVNQKTGLGLTASQFLLIEERDLANNHFRMYVETAGGLPIRGMSIRTWSALGSKDGALVQAEAFVVSQQTYLNLLAQSQFSLSALSSQFAITDSFARVRDFLKNKDDHNVHGLKVREEWVNGRPARVYQIKGARGTHEVTVSLVTHAITSYKYEEFPQGDRLSDETSLPVQIYPIYETVEATGHVMQRVPEVLTYLHTKALHTSTDPYSVLRNRHYYEDQFDPVLGETELGRSQGFWSMNYLKAQAALVRATVPSQDNTFANGMILEGRYTTISLHPDVLKKFQGLNFSPQISAQFIPNWIETQVNGQPAAEMIPEGALLGKPIISLEDAWNRSARIQPDNNPVGYMNDGFDEIQVYYAVNKLVDSLHNMGFTDPELSNRPFNAFLYNPDITMKDNAFYTDDTINFTTYSPGAPNMARDNSTIWHELGHGIMDRLMGDFIQLADTGGLSEGMADFVAALVIADVTNGQPFDGSNDFRIINNTGFFLTNEVHDDGEAYGGSMKDLLDSAVRTYGHNGVIKVADLTMETMRLTRNHPGLTAQDWFSHMLFADKLGHTGVRAPGELNQHILQALAGRNFNLDGGPSASFVLKNGDQDVVAGAPGSRVKPIAVTLAQGEKAVYHLHLSLKNSATYKFLFPVQVKVFFRGGPLQGAIRWDGETDQPMVKTLNSENDVADVDVAATGICDFVNREDGSCGDYAYIQVFNPGDKKPVAKKRFYLRMKPKA